MLSDAFYAEWQEVMSNLEFTGFENAHVQSMVTLLAAILHIGNITFEEAANVCVEWALFCLVVHLSCILPLLTPLASAGFCEHNEFRQAPCAHLQAAHGAI